VNVLAGTPLTHEARNTSITEWRWVPSAWRLIHDTAHLSAV